MKCKLQTILLAFTSIAAALPNGAEVISAFDQALQGSSIIDLQITDPRFPGQVFTGPINEIFKEMKGLKPELFVDDVLVAMDSDGVSASSGVAGVTKRQSIDCGWGDRWGTWNNCISPWTDLNNLGNAWCGVDAAPACARVMCGGGCGLFLCNKTGGYLQVYCRDIATDIIAIAEECSQPSTGAVNGAMHFDSHFTGLSNRQGC